MGAAVPLTATINGQKITVGKAFFDPASGEIKAMIDKNCPSAVRDAIRGERWEFSLAPATTLSPTAERLIKTTRRTTTMKEG